MTDLTNRRALVTGATSGIGAAIARTLTDAGAEVLAAGRDKSRGAQAAGEFVEVDLAAGPERLRAFAAEIGPVDILVNNAAIYPVGATPDMADADLERILAVNVLAPHILVGALAPGMAERGHGVVVNIGSWMGAIGTAGSAMYSGSKAALEVMTRCWAAEYGPRGVRFNTVAPGVTLTPGNAEFRPVLDALTAPTPAGHVVDPADVARAVLFLAGDDAAMLHGITLPVDGGIGSTRA